jgi:hypothetical protein
MDAILLIKLYAAAAGLDPNMALAVAKVESNFNHNAIGPVGEVGVMQLNPRYFDKRKVKDLKENIKQGIKHILQVKQECKHKINMAWGVCYNRGVLGGNKTNPENNSYVRRLRDAYRKFTLFDICKRRKESYCSDRFRNVQSKR